ncbi:MULTISPECIES: hypothetical protein [Pseudonocardiaceae]|uniref:Uncharacterized protein n=1 Tax=Prauserella endophytica TaxID=1592324 RepID=A0ABY2RTQ0_9PSEU|nr:MULTISPECIES: hypothetical protein [Pseudonocardiaceae]TKG60257.1 hypothetical protein FCN18_35840 [Prauserella endophytica]
MPTPKRRFDDERLSGLPRLLEAAQAAGVYSNKRRHVDGTRAYTPQTELLVSELWMYAYPVLLKALADDAGVSRARQLVGLPHISDEAREAIMFTAYHRGDLAGDMLLKAIPGAGVLTALARHSPYETVLVGIATTAAATKFFHWLIG